MNFKTKFLWQNKKGIIKLEGTIGDLAFYKTQDGHIARGKGGVSGDRIKNDAAYQRTRENMNEFGRAGAAGKLLRMAFRSLISNSADNRMVSRLTKEMVKVLKADSTSIRGQRNVLDGELELLQGFEFNQSGKLSSTLFMAYVATIDRATGTLQVTIPAFSPSADITSPAGTTHAMLVSAGASINFVEETFQVVGTQSAEIAIAPGPAATFNLVNQLPAGLADPLFLILGIEFYQKVNGVNYPLNNGQYNALSLVKVLGL